MYKTRRALKNLQYSPKGNDIAGQPTTTKRVDHKVLRIVDISLTLK